MNLAFSCLVQRSPVESMFTEVPSQFLAIPEEPVRAVEFRSSYAFGLAVPWVESGTGSTTPLLLVAAVGGSWSSAMYLELLYDRLTPPNSILRCKEDTFLKVEFLVLFLLSREYRTAYWLFEGSESGSSIDGACGRTPMLERFLALYSIDCVWRRCTLSWCGEGYWPLGYSSTRELLRRGAAARSA